MSSVVDRRNLATMTIPLICPLPSPSLCCDCGLSCFSLPLSATNSYSSERKRRKEGVRQRQRERREGGEGANHWDGHCGQRQCDRVVSGRTQSRWQGAQIRTQPTDESTAWHICCSHRRSITSLTSTCTPSSPLRTTELATTQCDVLGNRTGKRIGGHTSTKFGERPESYRKWTVSRNDAGRLSLWRILYLKLKYFELQVRR